MAIRYFASIGPYPLSFFATRAKQRTYHGTNSVNNSAEHRLGSLSSTVDGVVIRP